MIVRFRGEADMDRGVASSASVANDLACVKTHTSAKCRKNNSPSRHRTLVVCSIFDSQICNSSKMFLRLAASAGVLTQPRP
jgi:hypothetical protein